MFRFFRVQETKNEDLHYRPTQTLTLDLTLLLKYLEEDIKNNLVGQIFDVCESL